MAFKTLPEINTGSQSITSIGEGITNWHTNTGQSAPLHSTWTSTPSLRTLVSSVDERSKPLDPETIRRSLIALLPCQHDSDVIFESTNGWMVLQTMYRPNKDLFVNQDPQSYALNMAAIAREHTVTIARTLLHFAVCISSLPPGFDITRLSRIRSLDTAIQNYVGTVTSLVTSSDEMMCTLPGLETLVLLTIYHLNSANLRQSWLTIRRAMNLAQLMGFHRIMKRPMHHPDIETCVNANMLWRCIVDIETYLCLHLRLPFASEIYTCEEGSDQCHVHRAKLNTLARRISELDHNVTPHSYVQALALDEELESLMRQRSREFWEVPNIPSTARSPESSAVLERLVGQIWHFELKILVHLPFLLRAPNESRYEYSKIAALQASRNVILRWFALRNASITQACCRFGELGVFIATVTIGLDILIEMGTKEKSEVQKTRASDFAMVCRVIGEMEKLASASSREKIAARSAVVIKKLMRSLDPSKRTAQGARLTIPYFGTIQIAYHKPPFRPPFDLDSDTGRKLMTPTTGPHVPVFSFVSNELWPSTEESWGGGLDFDIVLYDGLEDMDTEGNWMF